MGTMKVIDTNVEGESTPTETIRKNSMAKNKKSAGMVGANNVSHV